jgi:hypothetical protein
MGFRTKQLTCLPNKNGTDLRQPLLFGERSANNDSILDQESIAATSLLA